MKNLILTTFATLCLTAAIAPVVHAACPPTDGRDATRMQQTGSYSQ